MNSAKSSTLEKEVEKPVFVVAGKKVEVDKPLYIAAHFGFVPVEAPRVSDADRKQTADCEETRVPAGHLVCDPSEKAAFIRAYMDRGYAREPHPLALSWRKGHDYSLELVGFPYGVAEAKLIRASLSILGEEGFKNLSVEINSIGDKESIAAFERELHGFARRLHHTLSSDIKDIIKDSIFHIARTKNLEAEPPSSISTLTAQSRAQFKEVLAYLDSLGVDYRFAPELVGNRHFCSETLFTIRGEENILLAGGYRYSRLSKRFGFKKELSLVGATVFCGKRDTPRKVYKDVPKPKFYLLHLGREAKMKALSLIETLRGEHIPLYHFLGKDKITAQMQTAESLRAPYMLIIGQKEALDNTVTVRNVSTRAQDTVGLLDLPHYLRHLPL